MTVDTVAEDARWASRRLDALAGKAINATLSHLTMVPGDWEVAVLGCDDQRIAELNAGFRGRSSPTNVLSWPSQDRAPRTAGEVPQPPDRGDPELGDIAISLDTCLREAEAAGLPFEHHVTHLLVHGTLHLLGYDHETDMDAELMEKLEVEILATLGVPNPY